MENCDKKGKFITIIVGLMAAVAYMYIKSNPDVLCDMKTKAMSLAKKTCDTLDDMTC